MRMKTSANSLDQDLLKASAFQSHFPAYKGLVVRVEGDRGSHEGTIESFKMLSNCRIRLSVHGV